MSSKQSIFINSPIAERNHEGNDDEDFDYDESVYGGGGCGCFRWSRGGGDESQSGLLRGGAGRKESWMVTKLKELKEYSEVVMGPKWKNLVRRLGRMCHGKKETTQFQYSPEGYALNFAAGGGGGDGEEELMHSFSTRFAGGVFVNEHQRRTAL